MQRRVAITGLGILSPLGTGADIFWDSLSKGVSGVRHISSFPTDDYKTKVAGEIPDFDPLAYGMLQKEVRNMDRFSQLAVAASEMAMQDSGLTPTDQTGLVMGTGVGGCITTDQEHAAYHTKGSRFIRPMAIPMVMCNAAAAHICRRSGLRGPGYTVVTACASGANAIGEAYRLIKHGYSDSMLAGGTEAPISELLFHGWCRMRVMTTHNDDPATAMRPFSKDRDGIVLSEAAAVVVLEEMETARARGAKIYAEICGYGSSNDAYHLVVPSMEGQCLALSRCLEDAGLPPEAVDYVNAHGTATQLNDPTETQVVKTVLGDQAYKTPISSIKAMVGHSLGAAGALECVACAQIFQHNLLPPTINLMEPDPDCDLDYVPNTARPAEPEVILSNSFGFGGNNAVLCFRRA